EVEWDPSKKRPDGVLVADLDPFALVCFLELKGRTKPALAGADPNERARAQLRGGVDHFGPAMRAGGRQSHGDLHHEQWLVDDLLPSISPSAAHVVAGVTVAFHSGTIPRPAEEMLFGKWVPFVLVQVSAQRNRADLTLEAFLTKAGLR